MSTDKCKYCGAQLGRLDVVHAVEGQLFCNKRCAVEHKTRELLRDAQSKAAEWYEDYAEVVSTQDIGIKIPPPIMVEIKVEQRLTVPIEAVNGPTAVNVASEMYYGGAFDWFPWSKCITYTAIDDEE